MAESKSSEITYIDFTDDSQIPIVKKLMEAHLSEPYPIYTYRYFLKLWPKLCIMAMKGTECIAAIVSKTSAQKSTGLQKGYIAMLAVEKEYRRLGIGKKLVQLTLDRMREQKIAEAILETETCNAAALRLYESFGFVRDKKLIAYYLNGNDAFRLRMPLGPGQASGSK